MLTSSSSKCYQKWTESVASQFLPNFTGPINLPCLDPTNPGNSNATNRAFFSWTDSSSTQSGNFTIYDQAIENPLPLIVATWLKDSGIQGQGGKQMGRHEIEMSTGECDAAEK
jgi:hypothetical protein